MKTLKQDFNDRITKLKKNNELCKCPFCGSVYNIDNIKGDWTDFFRFNVVGGFWELVSFSIKWIIFFFAFWYIGAYTISSVLQEPGIINYICEK